MALAALLAICGCRQCLPSRKVKLQTDDIKLLQETLASEPQHQSEFKVFRTCKTLVCLPCPDVILWRQFLTDFKKQNPSEWNKWTTQVVSQRNLILSEAVADLWWGYKRFPIHLTEGIECILVPVSSNFRHEMKEILDTFENEVGSSLWSTLAVTVRRNAVWVERKDLISKWKSPGENTDLYQWLQSQGACAAGDSTLLEVKAEIPEAPPLLEEEQVLPAPPPPVISLPLASPKKNIVANNENTKERDLMTMLKVKLAERASALKSEEVHDDWE